MRFFQIVESLAKGDAVANDAVAINSLLQQWGVCGGIFVTNKNNISKEYRNSIAKTIEAMPPVDGDDVVLFHHAIANDYIYELPKLKCKRILIYHNITPPSFFQGIQAELYEATRKGLEQIRDMRSAFDCCIADSEYNKQDLIAMGYSCPVYVCPVLIPFEDYKKQPNGAIIGKYGDGRKNILFVGRLTPNKKQEDIIRVFSIYKKYYEPSARLFLVGSESIATYTKALKEYVELLGVKDVIITGSVPFEDILAYYAVADVFLCMSEHEGLCVPLVEAMYFNIPILAFNSSAIPYTVNNSGVLLKEKDFTLAAGWINRLAIDGGLREEIIGGQREQLKEFGYQKVAMQLRDLLNHIINDTPAGRSADTKESVTQKLSFTNKKDFALIMPIKASDWKSAEKAIPLIRNNIQPRAIILISSAELCKSLPDDKDILFIEEGSMLQGLNLEQVRETLQDAGGNPKYAGWYLQQFLKLGFSRICPNRYYLVWDADTLPLNPISFFDNETDKPLFNLKREFVAPYFVTMKRLLQLDKVCPESFITEHMLFDAHLCREMLDEIESNSKIKGESFWEKCVYASDFSKQQQSFSEYETFGSYIMTKHKDMYLTRKLRTFRCGTDFLGENPSGVILDWVSQSFDTVSFEHWSTPIKQSLNLISNASLRREFSFSEIVQHVCNDAKVRAYMGERGAEEFYKSLKKKMEFDYCFGEWTVYEKMYEE